MRKIFSSLVIVGFICVKLVGNSYAYDFSSYIPTLDKKFLNSETTINSYYTLNFTSGTSASNSFTYYNLNSDNTITPNYYNIVTGINPSKNGPTNTRTTGTSGVGISGYFVNISNSSTGSAVELRSKNIQGITSDFIGNRTTGGYGGALFVNNSTTGAIIGDFINNTASSSGNVYGGAIYSYGGSNISSITGNFINNTASGNRYNIGGAILNDANIGNITGDFIANKVVAGSLSQGVGGGAIQNTGNIGVITGDFIANSVTSEKYGSGGAINTYNGTGNKITGIKGDFIGNYLNVKEYALGGAIASSLNNFGYIDGSFINNYATTTSSSLLSLGGAIHASKGMILKADGSNNVITGNYTFDNRGKQYNAIFVATSSTNHPTIILNPINNGNIIINDNIYGGTVSGNTSIDYTYGYNVNIEGDGTGSVVINNDIINASIVNVTNTTLKFDKFIHDDTSAINYDGKGAFKPGNGTDAVTNLNLDNSTFDISNGYFETINLKNYTSSNSYLSLDVNPDTLTSDILSIDGDLTGVTKLIINATSATNFANQGSILFAKSNNDSIGSDTSFEVFRVLGSPHMYEVIFSDLGGNSKEWYFNMFALPSVPEVVSYIGLHAAAIEQTKSLVDNLKLKVSENKVYCGRCNIYDVRYNNFPLKNAWINPIYYNSKTKRSSTIDANIWGAEAGYDIQYNANGKIGVFASYRNGDYDLNGHGKHFYSPVGSNININSYMGGLYYRYDRKNSWLFSTLYTGVQQANIKTKDGLKADTKGYQFSGSIEIGHLFPLKKQYTLEPSIGAFYTQLNFKTINDSAGKTAKFDNISYTELKASLRLEKTHYIYNGPIKLYIEPSILQTFLNNDVVLITGMNNINTYDEGTLGRFELGGRVPLDNGWSLYGLANYTFGKDYKATSAHIGVNYSW